MKCNLYKLTKNKHYMNCMKCVYCIDDTLEDLGYTHCECPYQENAQCNYGCEP